MRAAFHLAAIDLDGTLVDSAPDLSHCLGEALSQFDLPALHESRVRSFIGDGVANLVERALKAASRGAKSVPDFDSVFDTFIDCYRNNLFVRSRLYEGVEAGLAAMRDAGLRLACVTNKRGDFTEELLARAGIRELFDVVYAGDSLPAKKPEPDQLIACASDLETEPEQAVMIGDSTHDASAAQAAGFAFVWATYGYCPRIEPLPPRTLASISSFVELTTALGL